MREFQACLFCGGDLSEPDHAAHCDGRQGRVEELPLLVSGLTEDTRTTSAAAAMSVIESKDTQRAHVREAFRVREGRTDDAVQELLGLDGSSERPRRWELWKLGQIQILRDQDGNPIKRLTRTGRRAVVWIATELVA